jgi:hypothetical protein
MIGHVLAEFEMSEIYFWKKTICIVLNRNMEWGSHKRT